MIKFRGSYSPLQKQISPTQTRENGFLQGAATLAHATAPDSQLPLNPSAQCILKYRLSEHSCEQGETMIYPCFIGLRWSCKAAARLSNGNTLPWTWAPGSLGHSIQPGWSRHPASNMTMFRPHRKLRESNDKPVESNLFPMGLGYSLLLRALDLDIARKIKAQIHKHWKSPDFHVFLHGF